MRLARPRGHDPLPRHQQRVPLRAGAGRRERGRARTDGDAAARAGALGGPGARPLAPAAARGRCRRDRHLRPLRGLRLGSDAHVLRRPRRPGAARGLRRPAAASSPSASRCCGRARRAARSSSARSRSRARPGTPSTSWARATGRVRFVGHCIGLELNEPPYLAHGYGQPLELGNVVAIEPKLAFAGLRRRRHREQLSDRPRTARCS